MRLASLAMYANPARIAEANDALWAYLADHLKGQGVLGVPAALEGDIAYDAAWTNPDLLFAQACGYPYVSHLRDKVRLVATPAYSLPGCEGADMCSFIVVRVDDPAQGLADLKGRRAAINDPGSNSGSNLFRAAVAPLAEEGRFFQAVLQTGSHSSSLYAVRRGSADVAAVDCVTFGNFSRFDPDRLAGVRVLAPTPKGPGLPFITRATATDEEVAALRSALADALSDPRLAETRDTLSLAGMEILDDADYDRLAALERQATVLGYPTLR